MRDSSGSDALDTPFSVPFVHRLRFTRDVFGSDQELLADLLPASGDRAPRVQFWVDEMVSRSRGHLVEKIRTFCAAHADRLTRAGNVQIIPGGEAIKNDVHILERILKVFHASELDRHSYVVAIGGGAVLDAVGFAAAIAHRGIRLVRLPTTTLAQADSGVGVKSGVNLFQKKNWIGAFAVPWAVVNDAAMLRTLSERDFRCGFSECVKVALLKDAPMFDRLCRLASRIRRRQMEPALEMIRCSAQWHLRHITAGGDPFEACQARPLDFGHWSAHRLEAMSGYRLRHGEAVAIGLAIDVVYSALVHGLDQGHARRVLRCLHNLGFPLRAAALADLPGLFAGLEEFRQHLGGRLTLTMLRAPGDPVDVHAIDRAKMQTAIERVARLASKKGAAGNDA